MKTEYITPASISAKSREWMDTLPARHSLAGSGFEPRRAALIVLDMQRYFLDPDSHAFVPSAAAILPRVCELSGLFRGKGQPIILTRHLNTRENAGSMAEWWADLIHKDDPASEIIKELDDPQAIRVEKTQYDAFHKTDLEESLRGLSITQVVIAGVLTHLCCETTARSAFMQGFKVFFAVDGTATYHEEFHRATLLNLSHGFAVPVLVDDIRKIMGSL